MPPFRPSLPRPQLLLVVVALAASLFGLREYYIMLSVQKTSVAALLSATTVIGASVDLGWYAPSGSKINNLTSALESDGIYGFIYDSSQTPNNKYGTYNWCNMPHARKREYVKASHDYELKYVEVIQRHHKRTPYASNAFPVESYQWNCDDQGLYYFGRPFTKNGKSAVESYWQGFTGEINPFVPAGWIGSCQFPQITAAGLDDSWTHGKDLYEVYHDLLDFLPARNKNWRKKVMFRVTNNQITSQVAGMFINGMWGTTDSIPLAIQASGVDSLEPQYSCSVGSNLSNQIKSSSNSQWQQHLTKSSELFKTLDNISGVPSTDSGFHASFDHYYDNLSARQCHGKPLPCKLVDGKNSSTCVDQKMANAVYRMGQWEYSQMYRDASASLAASSTAYGVWIAELASHLRAVIKGESKTIYFHNFAHDGSTSRVLSILQIDEMVWPGMGSEIVFELYQKKKNVPKNASGYYVRVLFGGQTLKSSSPTLGLMEMVPVETLLGYFDGLVGENASLVKGKCSGSISV
ncbi:histidine phosphatase superfamily [Ilyonectria sp. MPI-CAGE-AT-0026]|nr:histidine phosphatase superfamily [Ilyonectria sp. MPI-CAGE-AT-0026]